MAVLEFPNKTLRALFIREYLKQTPYNKCVCFTCGNCATALRDSGIEVLSIGKGQDFEPTRWYYQEEIAKIFPDYFDATCGHLTIREMTLLGEVYKEYLGMYITEHNEPVTIKCGSGETLVALALVYPDVKFIAEYDNNDPATKYEPNAPLNALVERLAYMVIKK